MIGNKDKEVDMDGLLVEIFDDCDFFRGFKLVGDGDNMNVFFNMTPLIVDHNLVMQFYLGNYDFEYDELIKLVFYLDYLGSKSYKGPLLLLKFNNLKKMLSLDREVIRALSIVNVHQIFLNEKPKELNGKYALNYYEIELEKDLFLSAVSNNILTMVKKLYIGNEQNWINSFDISTKKEYNEMSKFLIDVFVEYDNESNFRRAHPSKNILIRISTRNKNYEITKILLSMGAFNIESAVSIMEEGNMDTVNLIKDNPKFIEFVNDKENSEKIVNGALQSENAELIQLLLNMGFKVGGIMDHTVERAIKNNNLPLLKLLLTLNIRFWEPNKIIQISKNTTPEIQTLITNKIYH